MKKILYLFPNANRAGAEQLTANLIRHRDSSRFQAEAAFLNPGPLVAELQSEGIITHTLKSRARLRSPLSVMRATLEIARLLRKREVDLVHSVMSYGHLFGGPAALLARKPEVWFQHGPTGRIDWLAGRAPTRTLFVNSNFTLKEEERYFPQSERLRLVYPGSELLNPEELARPAHEFRRAHGASDDEVVIGIVGRISPMKGQELFIDAFAKLAAISNSSAKPRAFIIGAPFMKSDETYDHDLRRKIRRLGLAKQVGFTGHVSFPHYHALAACDLIVNASVTPEPFGLTLIEGMMLGKAVIGPAHGGPLEILSHEETGLLFRPGDAESLAHEIGKVMQFPNLSALLRDRARKKAVEAFTAERMTREIEQEYDRILGHRSGDRSEARK